MKLQLLFVLSSSISLIFCADSPRKQYEYKYSFKGPLLVHETGTIPFFEHGGHAIASEDSVRLTPSMTNKKGWIFSKKKADFGKAFEAIFTFRVTGRGRIGADGLAFWYIVDKNIPSGNTLGGPSKWDGLAVVMDTYDNDDNHDHPLIAALVNNNSFEYDPDSDGSAHIKGRCIQDFRNRPFPIMINVTYYKNTLTVSNTQGLSEDAKEVQECFRVENLDLPAEGYFGFTAATGGLADDHDVYKLEVSSFREQEDKKSEDISDVERQKFEKEFAEYAETMRKAKEEFEKNNKHKKQRYQTVEEETEPARNLRQIWEGQAHIQRLIFDLMKKLDFILSQQDKWNAQIMQNVRTGGGDMRLPDNLARREDLHSMQENFNQRVHQLHTNLNEVSSSIKNLPSGHNVGGNSYEFKQFTDDMKDQINFLREMMSNLDTKVSDIKNSQSTKDDSSCPSCLSSGLFFFGILTQIVCVIGYFMYSQRMEAANKKFY